jgi:hypothetical protein
MDFLHEDRGPSTLLLALYALNSGKITGCGSSGSVCRDARCPALRNFDHRCISFYQKKSIEYKNHLCNASRHQGARQKRYRWNSLKRQGTSL